MNRQLFQNPRLLYALLLVHGLAAGVHGQKPGALLWKVHHPVASSPAIGTDGTVYIGSFGGWASTAINKRISNWRRSPLGKSGSSIFALDGKTGKKKWTFDLGGDEGLTPAIGSDGTVYVGPLIRVSFMPWMAKPVPKSGSLNGTKVVETDRCSLQLGAMVRFT